LVGSKILISDLEGNINILDANNGNEISTLIIEELALPPVPANKNIFFLTASGKLLAYE
jgi:hypothetical protein